MDLWRTRTIRHGVTTASGAPGRRRCLCAAASLMVSELVFLLLIVGVLGELVLFVLFQWSRSTARSTDARPSAVHQDRYLRYLAHVPECSEGGEDERAEKADSAGKRRIGRRSAASDAARPLAASPADGTVVADALAGDAVPEAMATSGVSGSRAAGGAMAASSDATVGEGSAEARSMLVASAAGSSASPVDMEGYLEVVVVNVTGGGQVAAPPAGTNGSGTAAGARLGGSSPRPQPDRQGREKPGGSVTLLLVGGSSGVQVPVASQTPADRLVSGIGQADGDPGHRGGRSARRLEFHNRGADVWKRWPDANRRNIVGAQGVETLNHALDLLQDSDAHAVAEDLFRKGIAIAFGEPSEFSGGHTHAAEFVYPDARPPNEPIPPPTIRLNPAFLHEDPRVLAALLAHEGTHVQQYLEGALLLGSVEPVDLETRAWTNGAVVWQQVRRPALSLQTPLIRDMEVGYQIARQGEGRLRDFIAAVYAH